ncbi:DUF6892 domain-containing protein [Campylobacterota bacterium DY0563]
MEQPIKFKNLNFKLAVITEITGNESNEKYCLDPWEFAKNYTKRNIDIEEEGYEIIPEIKEYYEKIEIFPSEVQNIEEIYQDGGDDIYLTLCPFWDGEDDTFNILSAEDVKVLPNLKKVVLFYQDDDNILKEFEKHNITAEWL